MDTPDRERGQEQEEAMILRSGCDISYTGRLTTFPVAHVEFASDLA
jgi:hypothetical protein